MSKYAEGTSVSTSQSLEEIKSTLKRFGASSDGFGYAERGRDVAIQFEIEGIRYVMRLLLPNRESFALNSYRNRRPDSAINKDYEQECRRLWRSLANGIKATMAMIQDGIVTAEQALSPYMMLPEGDSVWDRFGDDLKHAAKTGTHPDLVPGLRESKIIELPGRTGS